MALYVINFSIDAPDGYVKPDSQGQYHEDLSINEIESISELILEDVFGIVNAVPEHDEPDEEVDCGVIAHDYLFTQPFRLLPPSFSVCQLLPDFVPFHPVHVSTHIPEINSPPPQRRPGLVA